MGDYIEHWTRDEFGNRIFMEIPEKKTVLNIIERVDNIVIEIPYFNQAAQLLLFMKENTNTYPKTKKALSLVDDLLIANNAYDKLTEGAKATLLVTETKKELGL